MSTLFVNNLNTASGSTITVPTGKVVVGTDGGTFKSPGQIIQTVAAEDTTMFAQGGTSYSNTGLELDITPKYSNSKILVCVREYFTFRTAANTERQADFRLLRLVSGGSDVQVAFQRINQWTADSSTAHYFGKMSAYDKLDSPATTTAINYRTQCKLNNSSADLYVAHDSAICTMVAFEIAQ